MSGIAFRWLLGSSSTPPVRSELPEADNQTPEEALNALLEQFKSSSVPPTSRFNGEIDPQRQGKPITILGLWRHAFFLAGKAKDLATDLAYYHIKGPVRPSWGVEMTMLASFMRGLADHTHLADVPSLRAAFSIAGLIPTPSDALITPVTFRVKKRGLRGMLAQFDALEDNKREITAEWVVSKRIWQRLQKEWKGGRERERDPHHKVKERVVLFLHGGAYYTASAASHRLITINLSKHIDARVFSVNYRLAPDTKFPGPVHDAASAYFRLTEDLKIPPGNIIIAGDSAGGGLSTALMLYLRDEGYPLPGAAILMCPWVDLTMSCTSWDTNAGIDIITFPTDPADHMNPVAHYLGPTGIKKFITHPYASPLFGDFSGLPPMLIQSGDCEVLRDEVTLLAHKATLAGVEVTHEVYEDAVHVFQLYPFLEQSRKAFKSCRRFVFDTLPSIHRKRAEAAKAAAAAESIDPTSAGGVSPVSSDEGPLDAFIEDELKKEISGGHGGGDGNGGNGVLLDAQGEPLRIPMRPRSLFSGADGGPDVDGDDLVDSSSHDTEEDDVDDLDQDSDEAEDVERIVKSEPPTQDDAANAHLMSEAKSEQQERPSLWKTLSSKSLSHLPALSHHVPPRINTFNLPISTSRSQPQSPEANRLRTKSSSSFASTVKPLSPSPTVNSATPQTPRRRFNTTLSSRLTPLVPSLSLLPIKPEVRGNFDGGIDTTHGNGSNPNAGGSSSSRGARTRTQSHPDIVKLLEAYAQTGPANRTTTYQYQNQYPSAPLKEPTSSTSSSS